MSKTSFYTWKYVMKANYGLSETVVHKSEEWFKERKSCVKDAKTSFTDPTNSTKRIIVRKIIPIAVDEVCVETRNASLENLLLLSYAFQLCKLVTKLSTELCLGCVFEDGCDILHTCNTLTKEELVSRYIDIAWRELNEGHVMDWWRDLIRADPDLRDVSPFILCQYQCTDYLNNQLKTEQWKKEKLNKQIVRLLYLETRFA